MTAYPYSLRDDFPCFLQYVPVECTHSTTGAFEVDDPDRIYYISEEAEATEQVSSG